MHSNLIKSFIGEWCRNARLRSCLQGICTGHSRSSHPSITACWMWCQWKTPGSFHCQSLLLYVIIYSIWLILETSSHFSRRNVSFPQVKTLSLPDADVHPGGHGTTHKNKFKGSKPVEIVFIDIHIFLKLFHYSEEIIAALKNSLLESTVYI